MTIYRDYLQAAMTECAQAGATFLGQAIAYQGTGMTATFAGVPPDQLIELPVFENTQLGMSTGLSIQTKKPVISVFPRINFLLCAMDQLVLHLDAIPRYSDYRPKVIIRTCVATYSPLDPGPQHLSDYSTPLRAMLQTVRVERLTQVKFIRSAYRDAMASDGSTILVEYAALYDEEG